MAIESLDLALEQPNISFNASSTQFSENWILKLDSPAKVPSLIIPVLRSLQNGNNYNFPAIGEIHKVDGQILDSSVIAINYNISKPIDETYKLFVITVGFSNQINSINDSVTPVDAEPDFSFDAVDRMVLVTKDTETGKLIANTNNRPILVQENMPLLRFTLVRNEDDFDPKKARKHMGTLNSGTATLAGKTFPEGTCKLERWTGKAQYDSDGNLFWAVTYQVLIADEDEGFVRTFVNKDTVDTNSKPASVAVKGLLTNTEYKLDADGNFYNLADQKDSLKFHPLNFNTLKKTSWPTAARLQASPSDNINDLSNNISYSGNNTNIGLT